MMDTEDFHSNSTSKKFRKRAIEVTAYQWWQVSQYNGDERDVDYFRHPELPGHLSCGFCDRTLHDHGYISTLEGGHMVCPGDWIITGIAGEKYPCKPNIFKQTYEKVEETDETT